MQVPIISGIYTNQDADFRTSYPVNMIPVPKQNGISNGYLRPADGIDFLANVEGIDRGGINWNGYCYRVIGNGLFLIGADGSIQKLGVVTQGDSYCSFDYSFDYLAISSGGVLHLFDGSTVKMVGDEDIGNVKDVIWVDGYFMATDGEFLIVTELNDPFSVNSLKYGSAEIDPDPINALAKIRNEVYAIGRYTIELFDNVGGENFPFSRIDGAMIPKGSIGTHTCCKYLEVLAFVGSAKNEPISIYLGSSASAQKISNHEIDKLLMQYSEDVLSNCLLESRQEAGHTWLYFHLPDKTIVYDYAATQEIGSPVWFILSTNGQYTARNHVWCYDKWIVGHPTESKIGVLTNKSGHHWGDVVDWEFGTAIVYNESRGAIFHQLELVCLTGYVDFNVNPFISTSYSNDGQTWSQPKFIKSGTIGNRAKRLIWLQQGMMRNWRIQKFSGDSNSRISIARLEATIEQLGV